jgi:hypothetical protein
MTTETPPVDRKLACAREAAALTSQVTTNPDFYRTGKQDDSMAVRRAILAIELYESGFGK